MRVEMDAVDSESWNWTTVLVISFSLLRLELLRLLDLGHDSPNPVNLRESQSQCGMEKSQNESK
jgi:hypothetical protein